MFYLTKVDIIDELGGDYPSIQIALMRTWSLDKPLAGNLATCLANGDAVIKELITKCGKRNKGRTQLTVSAIPLY